MKTPTKRFRAGAHSASAGSRTSGQAWIHEQARRIKIRNDKEAGNWIPRAEHEAELTRMQTGVAMVFKPFPTKVASQIVGLTVPEIEIAIQAAVAAAITEIRNGGGDTK